VEDSSEKVPNDLTFERALERLEEIVEAMEEGEISLEELLQRYEEGNKLLKVCNQRLRDAELKIEVLKKSGDSESLSPLETDPS